MAMMIQKFHRLIQSKVLWIGFLILVCVSFVGLYIPGMGKYQRSVKAAAEGEYEGESVPPDEFRHHYLSAYLRIAIQTMRPPRITDEIDTQLRTLAWRRLATLKEAKKLGLRVPDAEVVAAIRRQPLFNAQGRFSQATYNAFVQRFLAGLGVSETQFEAYMREEVLINKMAYMVAQGALIPPDDLKRRFNMLRDEFTVEYALITPDQVEDDVSVTPEEARAFYEADPEPFRVPDKVAVRLVQFNVDDFLDKIQPITEEAAREYYDDNIESFTYSEKKDDTEPPDAFEAEDMSEAAEADAPPTDGEELAAVNEPKADAVKAEVVDEEDVVQTADEEVSVAIDTNSTSFTLKGDDFEDVPAPVLESTIPFEEAQDEIMRSLARQAARNMAAEAATDFVVKLAPDRTGKAPTFEDAAAEAGLAITDLEPFAETEEILGTSAGPRFNSAAFSLEDNPDQYFSDAIIGENNVYVLKLEKAIPSHIPPYEEVEPEVLAAARASEIDQAMTERAHAAKEAAEEAIQSGKTFRDGVATLGLEVEAPDPFTSATGMFDLEYSDAVIAMLRDNNPGEVAAPQPVDGGILVGYVAKREPANPAEFSSIRDQIQNSMRQRQGGVLFDLWQDYLLKRGQLVDRHEQARTAEPEPDDEDEDLAG